jgi:hypothetical protein
MVRLGSAGANSVSSSQTLPSIDMPSSAKNLPARMAVFRCGRFCRFRRAAAGRSARALQPSTELTTAEPTFEYLEGTRLHRNSCRNIPAVIPAERS